MVKPAMSIRKTAPISEIGMATTGMRTERNEPRKRKIFLFLGSFRSVLIPVVAIPISLIGAVFLMLIAGFTINLLTSLAIVLSVVLVVDDAIVMVENVERHLHLGKPPFRAALDAARELVAPIIAMTITLAAVYTPVAIQGGLTGALFREFAFTLAGAVIVSGFVALTL